MFNMICTKSRSCNCVYCFVNKFALHSPANPCRAALPRQGATVALLVHRPQARAFSRVRRPSVNIVTPNRSFNFFSSTYRLK